MVFRPGGTPERRPVRSRRAVVPTPPAIRYGFGLRTAESVYIDPCNLTAGELDPPIGPSVDDPISALSILHEFQVSAPMDVAVGAFRGKEIELTRSVRRGVCPGAIPWRGGEDTIDLDRAKRFGCRSWM